MAYTTVCPKVSFTNTFTIKNVCSLFLCEGPVQTKVEVKVEEKENITNCT